MPPLQQTFADWINRICRVLEKNTAVIAFWKITLSYALQLKGLYRVLGIRYISLCRRDFKLTVATRLGEIEFWRLSHFAVKPFI